MTGRSREAASLLDRARAIVDAWRARRPEDVRWQQLDADVDLFAGRVAQALGRPQEALGHLEAAGATYASLRAVAPGNTTWLGRVGTVEKQIGMVLEREARRRQGEELARRQAAGIEEMPPLDLAHHPHWREAYRIQKLLAEKDLSNAGWAHAMIDLCNQMAQVESESGGDAARVTAYRDEALAYARRMRDCDPDNVLHQHLYAYTLFHHATQHQAADADRARAQFAEVLDVCERIAPRHRAGLVELAVLATMSMQHLSGLLPAAALRAQALRRTGALLEAAHDENPSDAQVFTNLRRVRGMLVEILASGSGSERSEALRLLDVEIGRCAAALAGADLDEKLRAETRDALPALRERRAALAASAGGD
jgi:tetratricopeptide (TPR) repeat protein